MDIFVAITSPEPVDEEIDSVIELINLGWRMHVRRPDWSIAETEDWLAAFDPAHLSKMRLHGHRALVEDFNLAGQHLRSAETLPNGCKAQVFTKSFHEFSEIREFNSASLKYGFLSPIFPSISKSGYAKEWNWEELRTVLKTKERINVVALGGVDEDKVETVKDLGFDGLALMGAFWQLPNTKERIALAQRIMKKWGCHEDSRK